MQTSKLISYFCFLMIVVSCEKDIKVKVPAQSSKLVVYSKTGINNPFSAYIGKSKNILDITTIPEYEIRNAVVHLYENGQLRDSLVYIDSTRKYQVKHNTTAKAGALYMLRASVQNYQTAEAETTTPGNINIQSLSRRQNVRADDEGHMYDEIKIVFTDNPAVPNFYRLTIRRPYASGYGTHHYSEIYCLRSMDKDIDRRTHVDPGSFDECLDHEIFMTDQLFNGLQKELIIYVRHEDLITVSDPVAKRDYRAVIELDNMTADHYKYQRSVNAHRDSQDNPFAEPVLVFSNVKNGFGIFSTYNLAVDTIR